jgi:hypothetical protein
MKTTSPHISGMPDDGAPLVSDGAGDFSRATLHGASLELCVHPDDTWRHGEAAGLIGTAIPFNETVDTVIALMPSSPKGWSGYGA